MATENLEIHFPKATEKNPSCVNPVTLRILPSHPPTACATYLTLPRRDIMGLLDTLRGIGSIFAPSVLADAAYAAPKLPLPQPDPGINLDFDVVWSKVIAVGPIMKTTILPEQNIAYSFDIVMDTGYPLTIKRVGLSFDTDMEARVAQEHAEVRRRFREAVNNGGT